MSATAGWPTASARRANALVIGRWWGVSAIVLALAWQLLTKPNTAAMLALIPAALVAGANFLQRRFLVALQQNAEDNTRSAQLAWTRQARRIRALGRVLLALDTALVV